MVWAVSLVMVALVGWAVIASALAAKSLYDARKYAQQAKAAVFAADSTAAQAWLEKSRDKASSAKRNTDSIVVKAFSAVPVVGRPFDTLRATTNAVDQMTRESYGPAVEAAHLVATRMSRPGGGIDLKALEDSRMAVRQTLTAVAQTTKLANDIPRSYLPPIDHQVADFQYEIRDLGQQVSYIDNATDILPAMLGGSGRRSYFLGMQTPAESRGTGGLIGGTAVIDVDNGTVKIDHASARKALESPPGPIDLGPDFNDLYGRFNPTTEWVNSNMSPHFPTTGQLWQHLWEAQSGVTVDGVVSVDPMALSYLLEALGPVQMEDGEVIDATNVIDKTLVSAYARFGDDLAGRKAYLSRIATLVADRVGSWSGNTTGVLKALGRGVSEGRISMWSSHPDEQVVIATTPLAHMVPYSPAPYAAVVINNSGGNKLDYYLDRQIEYWGGRCDGLTRDTNVRVTLANDAPDPATLPEYVLGRQFLQGVDVGTNRLTVALHASWGAGLRDLKVNGTKYGVVAGWEQGHPVYYTVVDVKRGESVEVDFALLEPASKGTPAVPTQALVRPAKVTVDLPQCS